MCLNYSAQVEDDAGVEGCNFCYRQQGCEVILIAYNNSYMAKCTVFGKLVMKIHWTDPGQ